MNFEEIFDEFDPPMRLWRSSGGGFTWTILYNGHGEYAANCHDSEEGVLVGGPWDSFEEAKAACDKLFISTKPH